MTSESAQRLPEEALRDLAGRLQGALIEPGAEGYDQARHVFNAMIVRYPALVIRCASPTDVVQGVNFARTHTLPLSMKGGGHSVAGSAVCEGGVMLDLSSMKAVRVDPEQRIAVADAGLTLAEFDQATQAHGLATTLGVVSMTGIAGLTLGGGIGWLNGKYGLSCDNVLSAEIVVADGRLLTASAEQNPDLFWAIRGGGGNFGVVTSFTYKLHPVSTILGGGVTYPAERAHATLKHYHAIARSCPDELSTAASIGRNPEGQAVVSVAVCYCGPLEEGERVVRPLREFGPPIAGGIGAMSYTAMQTGADGGFPRGRRHYWKASFLRDLTDDAIATILRFAVDIPSPYSGIGLQQMTGVASRVDPTATAFAHRARQYDFLVLSQWDDPAADERNITWTRALFKAMQPYLEHGVYVNDLNEEREEGQERIRSAYGANYERLAAIKSAYDPTNLFRLNHNIKPA
jgi:FAD/FMN-containing dehydrogenase